MHLKTVPPLAIILDTDNKKNSFVKVPHAVFERTLTALKHLERNRYVRSESVQLNQGSPDNLIERLSTENRKLRSEIRSRQCYTYDRRQSMRAGDTRFVNNSQLFASSCSR